MNGSRLALNDLHVVVSSLLLPTHSQLEIKRQVNAQMLRVCS